MIIKSAENEHIKLYKKLCSAAKFRREYGLFTLEGQRLLRDFTGTFHSVFYTESERSFAETLHSERFFEIPDALSKNISDTKNPQGVFAIAPIPRGTVNTDGKTLVLHTVRDPGNLGTIIRTADALGFRDIFAIDCADIFSPKTVRSAMGALFRVNIEVQDEYTVFERLANAETFASVLSDSAEQLGTFGFPEKSAIFIGNEANGLPEETIKKCCRQVTIKMNGNAESLNAAAAASILLWVASK
jgi:TrmH family RNA methyltransferase